jgi:hypothetical protein
VVNSLNANDKKGLLPPRACRNHITDLHLAIADDGTIDEQFHQLSALGTVEAVQGGSEALTKGGDVASQPDEIQLLLRRRLQLVKLLGEPLLVLLALLPLPLKLITFNDGHQVYFQQPGLLTLQLFQCLPDRPSSRLQHPDHRVLHTARPQRTSSTHVLPIFAKVAREEHLEGKFVVYGDDDTFGVENFALGCNQLEISHSPPMLSVH